MTAGVLLINFDSFAECREIAERVSGGETYPVGIGGGLQIFPDDADAWQYPVGTALSLPEFFRRFVHVGHTTPNKERPMSIASTFTAAGSAVAKSLGISLPKDDDRLRAEREKLPTLNDVRLADEAATTAANATAEAFQSGKSHEWCRQHFGDKARAAGQHAFQLKQKNEQRQMLGPDSLNDAKRLAVEEFMEAFTKRKTVIERLQKNHERSASLKAAVQSGGVNLAKAHSSQRASVESDTDDNQRQLDMWQREKDRLLADLARTEPVIRAAHDARGDADDVLSDFCGVPRRQRKSVESFLELPAWLKTEPAELATA